MDMAPAPPGERRYKGVRLRKWGPWVSEIRLPNSRERIWLGSYDAPEKAARAFDAAYLCLRGPGGAGGLNFPGSPPPNVGRTSDPEEVYAAAVFHANRAAAAAAPRDAGTDQPPVDAAAVVPPAPAPAPLQVPARSSDWAELLLADLPPLFSPTYAESHAYLTAADDDDNMEEIESVSCPGGSGVSILVTSGAPVADHVDWHLTTKPDNASALDLS